MAITRITKPPADYHEWPASGLSEGDIIGVKESLGGRPAKSLMAKGGPTGDSFIRLNVVQSVYATQKYDNSFLGDAAAFRKPGKLEEFISPHSSHIRIEANTVYTWEPGEIYINDIEITVHSGVSIHVN